MHGVIEDPITILPNQYISDVLALMDTKHYKFSTFPVLDSSGILVGLLSSDVVKPRHATKTVQETMKKREDIKTVPEEEMRENPIQRAEQFFTDNVGINKLLIVDENDKLRGLVTASDVERIMRDSHAPLRPTSDEKHRLAVGASLYLFRNKGGQLDKKRILSHVEALVER